MRFFAAFTLALCLFAAPAAAQNISGVSGADVKAGDTSIQYRAGFSAEDDGAEEAFAHRLHLQHSFDDSWFGRVIVFQGKRGSAPLTTRSVGLEFVRQFVESENSGGWDSAIRVDGLIPVERMPGRARIAWLNTVELNDRWEVRGNIYLSRAFGDAAADGLSIETREEATYKLDSGVRIGAQMFNNFNTTAHFGGFDEQRHQAGPVLKAKLADRVKLEAGALFGLSRAASDADFRVFLNYSF
jgi:hypothetical protein